MIWVAKHKTRPRIINAGNLIIKICFPMKSDEEIKDNV